MADSNFGVFEEILLRAALVLLLAIGLLKLLIQEVMSVMMDFREKRAKGGARREEGGRGAR